VNNTLPQNLIRHLQLGALLTLMALGSMVMLRADSNPEKSASPSGATNAADAPATPGLHITTDDDDSPPNGKGHSHSVIEINGEHEDFNSLLESIIIPTVAILATFGTPVLIVFFICYFKYRRRRENLATVREYLSKGLPIPPQLLDESQGAAAYSVPAESPSRCKSDMRRGFKLTFIGLGITLALYAGEPRSTDWAWGLIPMVMGIGYLLSGWVETRHKPVDSRTTPPPPPGTPL